MLISVEVRDAHVCVPVISRQPQSGIFNRTGVLMDIRDRVRRPLIRCALLEMREEERNQERVEQVDEEGANQWHDDEGQVGRSITLSNGRHIGHGSRR